MRKIHIKKIILLVAFFFFSQMVFSQNKSVQQPYKTPTAKVWGDLTWETTEIDIKQKYGNQLTILETFDKYGNGKYYCPFEILNYELSGYEKFTVSFLFDKTTKKLAQINLTKENPTNVLSIIQDLKTSLSEKYGKPQTIEETPKYEIKWYLTELDIELGHLYVKGIDKVFMNSIIITYKKSTQTQQLISNRTKQLKKQTEKQQLEVPTYQLFPTGNNWTFIKLDTRNGKMWQVHFSVSEEGYQGEKDLNPRSLVLTDEEINGRFTLFSTKNIYNFILLDQLTGKSYQVQWNDEFLNRFVTPIW
jgi:hypothetical protein